MKRRTKYFTSRGRNILQYDAVGLDAVMMVELVRSDIMTRGSPSFKLRLWALALTGRLAYKYINRPGDKVFQLESSLGSHILAQYLHIYHNIKSHYRTLKLMPQHIAWYIVLVPPCFEENTPPKTKITELLVMLFPLRISHDDMLESRELCKVLQVSGEVLHFPFGNHPI